MPRINSHTTTSTLRTHNMEQAVERISAELHAIVDRAPDDVATTKLDKARTDITKLEASIKKLWGVKV